MVVIGGASNHELRVVGAAFERTARRWRRLSRPPGGFPSGHVAVWTGKEVAFWGGRTAGAAYAPTTKTWRRLPAPRIDGRIEHSAVWTGREVVVWGGEACNDGCYRADGAAYSPPD
jgi:hypothetical protein